MFVESKSREQLKALDNIQYPIQYPILRDWDTAHHVQLREGIMYVNWNMERMTFPKVTGG